MNTILPKKLFLSCIASLMTLGAIAQNPNDQCSGAVTLSMNASYTCVTPTTANTTTGDPTTQPSCWSFANDDGIWYKFTATNTTAIIELSDNGNTYTPMVAVYSGGASPGTCPATTASPIAGGCLNYTSTYGTSQLSLSGLTVGNVYYILVDQPSTISTSFCIEVNYAPASSTATTSCPSGVSSPINTVTCTDVGTGAMNGSAGVVSFSSSSSTAPSATCGGGATTTGSWAHYQLNGATDLTFNWEVAAGGSGAAGNHNIWAAFYQGSSCASLTQVSCQEAAFFSSGSLNVNNLVVTGLDSTKDLWVYMWDDAGKSFTLPYDVTGAAAIPSNDACSGATAGSSTGCNLGALGDGPWTGPSNQTTCTGGSWTTNENTVWYSFTATSSTASLSVNNVVCDDGNSGSAQFAAFTNCSCVTTYSATYASQSCFLGCAVGTGNISISSITSGQTIYIAVDGTAGSICAWSWNLTNLTLPVDLLSFGTKCIGTEVELDWETATEENSDYFTVEKSFDGESFFPVKKIRASGNSTVNKKYSTIDPEPFQGISYYRLTETDKNGEGKTFRVIPFMGCGRNNFSAYSHDNMLTILGSNSASGTYHVSLYNSLGEAVLDADRAFSSDTNQMDFEVNAPTGIYLLVVDGGNTVSRQKVFLQR